MAAIQQAHVARRMVAALVWRTRREGLKSIILVPLALSLFIMLITAFPLLDPSGSHGTLSSPSITGGGVMGYLVATMAMASALTGTMIGAGTCVQSAVGSEAVNGSFELMLGTGFTPRQIWSGFVGVVVLAVTAMWAVIGVVLAVFIALILTLGHIGLAATPGFWALLVLAPLVLALAGAILGLGVGLSNPAFFEPTRNGLMHASNGIAGLFAAAPGLICLLLFLFTFSSVGAAWAAVFCAAAVVACVGVGWWFGTKRFSREQVISSL